MVLRFNEVLKVVNKHITEYLDGAIRHYAALPKMPERVVPEGNGVITVLENGQEADVELRKMEASATRKLENFVDPDPEKIYGLLQEIAFQIASQQQQLLMDKVGGAADEVGNSLAFKGNLTPQHVFDMYRRITLDFYHDGQPHELAMFSGPEMTQAYGLIMERIATEPELKREFAEIIDLKRKQWNVRESNRKLVG